MKRIGSSVIGVLLHASGFAVLATAWQISRTLMTLGRAHVGNEPLLVYLLALLTFLLASAGAALAVMGRRLFEKIVVAEPWLPHVPSGFAEPGTRRSR